jgi:uncharacterized protein YhhL (DUF1145 family)
VNADLLRRGRAVLAVLWVVLAACFLLPADAAAGVVTGRIVFGVMLLVHALEFLYFRSTLERLGGSMGHHFVQVLLFGVVHVQLARVEAGEVPAGPDGAA